MNAFDLSRALLTFYKVYREQAISAEDKRAIFADMLASIPDERVCTHKGARAVLVRNIEKAHGEYKSRPETTSRTQGSAQEAPAKVPKEGLHRRK